MRYAKIGGQAVIEGVMMRHGDDYAVAVRKPDQTIEIKKDVYVGLTARWHMRKVPIVRGVLAFVDSLVLGMSTLTYSASFYEDEEDGAAARAVRNAVDVEKQAEEAVKNNGKMSVKTDSESAEKSSIKTFEKTDNTPSANTDSGESLKEKLLMGFTVALSIALAVVLFMLTPLFISSLFGRVIKSSLVLAILEGVIRLIIFFAYIIAISQMKDIQRVFMYHGAEHKTINCIEHGEELTPENAAKHSRLHKRCGTSFLLIVMVISVVCFIFIRVDGFLVKVLSRIVLVPIIAGVSYEIIQWAGRSESRLVEIVSRPGMMLQKLTTREPDLEMLEVAIASIEAIYDWRAFQEEEKR